MDTTSTPIATDLTEVCWKNITISVPAGRSFQSCDSDP